MIYTTYSSRLESAGSSYTTKLQSTRTVTCTVYKDYKASSTF